MSTLYKLTHEIHLFLTVIKNWIKSSIMTSFSEIGQL